MASSPFPFLTLPLLGKLMAFGNDDSFDAHKPVVLKLEAMLAPGHVGQRLETFGVRLTTGT